MNQINDFVKTLNEHLLEHPDLLPKMIYDIKLADASDFHLDGNKNRFIEGLTEGEPDCVIETSTETLMVIFEDPAQALKLIMTGRLKISHLAPVLALSSALKGLSQPLENH